jgi:outer membrane murein-binding lipoprotein Lpp
VKTKTRKNILAVSAVIVGFSVLSGCFRESRHDDRVERHEEKREERHDR